MKNCKPYTWFFIVALTIVLTGCSLFHTTAHDTSIYRQKIDPGEDELRITSIDAKQRVIMSKKLPDLARVYCAEPSPDALSATSSILTGGITSKSEKTRNLSLKILERATYIGLRTQTVQLLRDAMYRICEAYWGGAFDKDAMIEMHERFQLLMVGLLAIEQLTGAVSPPVITISPEQKPSSPTNGSNDPDNGSNGPDNGSNGPDNGSNGPDNGSNGPDNGPNGPEPLSAQAIEKVSQSVENIAEKTLKSLRYHDTCVSRVNYLVRAIRASVDNQEKLREDLFGGSVGDQETLTMNLHRGESSKTQAALLNNAVSLYDKSSESQNTLAEKLTNAIKQLDTQCFQQQNESHEN